MEREIGEVGEGSEGGEVVEAAVDEGASLWGAVWGGLGGEGAHESEGEVDRSLGDQGVGLARSGLVEEEG